MRKNQKGQKTKEKKGHQGNHEESRRVDQTSVASRVLRNTASDATWSNRSRWRQTPSRYSQRCTSSLSFRVKMGSASGFAASLNWRDGPPHLGISASARAMASAAMSGHDDDDPAGASPGPAEGPASPAVPAALAAVEAPARSAASPPRPPSLVSPCPGGVIKGKVHGRPPF
jgi:hypothetical protein